MDEDLKNDPEDELRAENSLLRLKLETEHGLQNMETSSLSPAAENNWLNYIHNFEEQFKNKKRIRVYDALGKPAYRHADELNPAEAAVELARILEIMQEKGIDLSTCTTYDNVVIYRFITEELFNHEMVDISIEGMTTNFIYEEFHPNHDHDLRRYVHEFVERLMSQEWNEEFDSYSLADTVFFRDTSYDNATLASIIRTFQDAYASISLELLEIDNVNFNVESGEAIVQARLKYSAAHMNGRDCFDGVCTICFTNQNGYWYINRLALPGFGD